MTMPPDPPLATQPPDAKRRPRRWLGIALGVSLAINLLLVGAIAGFALSHRGGGGAFADGARLLRSMPPERRAEIRALFREARATIGPLRQDLRAARRAVALAARAEPFDARGLEAALTHLHARELAIREASRPLVLSLMAKLQPHERERVLRILAQRIGGVEMGRPRP